MTRKLSPAIAAALLPGRIGDAVAHKLSAMRVRPALVIRGGRSITRAATEPLPTEPWIAEMQGGAVRR